MEPWTLSHEFRDPFAACSCIQSEKPAGFCRMCREMTRPCRIFLGTEAVHTPEKSRGLQKRESGRCVRHRRKGAGQDAVPCGSTSCPAISFAGDPGPISCCWPVTAVSRKADGDRDEVNSRPEIGTPQPEGKHWKGVGTSSAGIFGGG